MIKPAVFGTKTCGAPHDDDNDGDADENSDDDGNDDPGHLWRSHPTKKFCSPRSADGASSLKRLIRFHLCTPGRQNKDKQTSNKVGTGKINFDGKIDQTKRHCHYYTLSTL